MKSPVLGIPVINASFADQVLPGEPEAAAATDNDGLILCDDCKQDIGMINHKDSVVSDWMARFRVKANKRVQGIREYVNSGPSISQSLKEKLRFFHKKTAGGVERVFRKAFSIKGKEKLLKSWQCYLSTTTGPISGMLFISTERIAFLSNTSLQLTSHYGEITRFRYKVMIPLARVKNVFPIDSNLDMPKGKYIQIVTVDEFDFWFMGFVQQLSQNNSRSSSLNQYI